MTLSFTLGLSMSQQEQIGVLKEELTSLTTRTVDLERSLTVERERVDYLVDRVNIILANLREKTGVNCIIESVYESALDTPPDNKKPVFLIYDNQKEQVIGLILSCIPELP